MEKQSNDLNDIIPRLFALASKLEGEGQYNNAKLLRATADSLARQAAVKVVLPSDNKLLASEMGSIIEALRGTGLKGVLENVLKRGASKLSEGVLPMFRETPNPFVCRYCGFVTFEKPSMPCPECSAQEGTFKEFLPVFWLNNFDSSQSLDSLRRTPEKLTSIISGLTEEELNRVPPDGGWNIHNAVTHVRDAQGLLEFRLGLMLNENNPLLESRAVFEWAADEDIHPPDTQEIFDNFLNSRHQTLTKLERLSQEDWRRTGRHEEFGTVTIVQQASYFATHELSHFPQIQALLP